MPGYSDFFEVQLRYTDYVREKSLLIHQYVKNVQNSGTGVELEVRKALSNVLPARFKITSGYIVHAESRTSVPQVSPQTDIIIVDTLVPHSLWIVDAEQGIEVVPREAVVGVIEVKRTLDRAALKSALGQLASTRDSVGLSKDDEASLLPGGLVVGDGITGPYRGNPLLGVIGLVAGADFEAAPGAIVSAALDETPVILDFALTLSGSFTATARSDGSGSCETRLVQSSISDHWSQAEPGGRVGLAQGLGFIQAYIGRTCGRVPDAEAYYFNDSIKG
jgi:hypothetical protein